MLTGSAHTKVLFPTDDIQNRTDWIEVCMIIYMITQCQKHLKKTWISSLENLFMKAEANEINMGKGRELNLIISERFQFFIEMIKINTEHAGYFLCCSIIDS